MNIFQIIRQFTKDKPHIIVFLLVGFLIFGSFLSYNIYKLGAFSATPRTDTIGVDGQIYATAVGPDGTIYIGGFFDAVVSVPNVGGGVSVDSTTATANLNSRARTNGRVKTAVSDGSGGWYIGGSFSLAYGVPRNNIAHINSNGTLDSNFDPSVDGEVLSLVLDGSTLYSVGNFLTVNVTTTPVLRKRAAAFSTSNGVVTSWDPSLNSTPVGMIIASSTAYIFGSGFTRVNSTTTNTLRNGGIAAFDLADGTVTSWNPTFGGSGSAKVISAAASADTLYVGGTFTTVNSVAHKSLAAFNLLDGSLKSGFTGGVTDPQFLAQAPPVYAIAVSSTTVYVGGIFEVASSTTSTTTRVNLAAFDTTGVVKSWNPDISVGGTTNSSYPIKSMVVNNNAVYVTGTIDYVNIGTTNTARRGWAAFDFVNGTVTSWDPDPICGTTKYYLNCVGFGYENVNVVDDEIYIGGGTQNMNYVGPYVDRNGLAAIDPNTGQVTSWNPNVIISALNPGGVYTLAVSNDTVYAGGTFTTVNGATTRNGLAAFNMTDGTATSWDPNVTVSGNYSVRSIALSSTTLYAGGVFRTVNGGTTRNNLAAFNLTDGTATSWNPDIDTSADPNTSETHTVFSIALSSNTLYAGGLFDTVNNNTTPLTRYNLAAFNLTDGTATSWNPSIKNSPINDTDWATSTAGTAFTLVLKNNGTLWSFGCDCYGELGGDHARDSSDPTQVGTDTWLDVAAGDGDASAVGVKSDGTLWGWGYNAFGELGLGDMVIHRSMTQVGTDTDWRYVSMGYYHALGIKSNGTLYAWGSNYTGELGQNDQVSRFTPTQVGVATNWSKISAGDEISAGIKTDGTLWTWGNNGNGQLGLGDTTERDVPTQVGTDTDWVSVIAGDTHMLGLKSGGTLWAWGNNGSGRLGVGDTTQRTSPTQVGTDTDWASVGVGDNFSFGVKTNGKLYAWGYNANYRLGLNDTTQRTSPVQVGTDTDWASVSGGYDHGIAIKTTGRMWGWGSNTSGEIGQNWSGANYYQVPIEVVRKDQDIHVYKIALNSNTLYAAGQFSSVNYATTPVYRDDVAGFNLTTGTVTNFNPNLGAKAYGGWSHYEVQSLMVTDDMLYLGRTISVPSPSYTYSSFSKGVTKLPGETAMSFNLYDSSLGSWIPGLARMSSFSSLTSFYSTGNSLIIGGYFDETNSTTTHNFLTNLAIFSNTSPNAPTSLGPTGYVDGSSTSNTQPQFTFSLSDNDSGDSVKYQIIISQNSDMSSPVVSYTSGIGAQGSFSFTVGQLAGLGTYTTGSFGQTLSNGSYYWEVKTIDQDGATSAYTLANSGAIAFIETGATTCNVPTRINMGPSNVLANDTSSGYKVSLSADGRYTAYSSKATNIVTGDTNGVEDVFVYDSVTGLNERVSVASDGTEGDGASMYPSISADGRYVAYKSISTNLVSGDTNSSYDIFIHDRNSDTTVLVSRATGVSGDIGDSGSHDAYISPDGTKIGFSSTATNLVSGDTNGVMDVFIRDLSTYETTRISVSTGGTEGDGNSLHPVLSYDGLYVAFESEATNIVSPDTNGFKDIFLRDIVAGTTVRVSESTGGVQGNLNNLDPAISWDGKIVAFEADSDNLVSGDTNSDWDVYVKDMNTGTLEMVNLNDRGAHLTTYGYAYYEGYLSYDGRYVSFESANSDVVSGYGATQGDIFIRDRVASTTLIASVNENCEQAWGWGSAISASGQYVSYMTWGTNILPTDTNGIDDNILIKMFDDLPVTISSLGPSNKVDGSSSTETSPSLTFNFSFPAKYEIQIDDTSDFSSPVVDYISEWGQWNSISFTVGQSVGNGSYVVGSAGQSLSDGGYYWRVRATDNNGISTSYSTANSGAVAFIVTSGSTPVVVSTAANGPVVGSFGQVRSPYLPPFIASIQAGNPPPPPPNLGPVTPEPTPTVEVNNSIVLVSTQDTNTTAQTTPSLPTTTAQSVQDVITTTAKIVTPPTPTDLSSLPPCPIVLGASTTKEQNEKTNSGNSSSNSTTVGNDGQVKTGLEGNGNVNTTANAQNGKNKTIDSDTVALPVDGFDYSINNGTTIKEVNAIFVEAIKHARDFRKLTIDSVDDKSSKHNDVIKYANDQFKIARDLAREARKKRRTQLKNNITTPPPITSTSTPPVPVPTDSSSTTTPDQMTGTTTTSTQVSTGSTTTTSGSSSSTSSTTSNTTTTSTGSSSGTAILVNTGTSSTTPDGKPCVVYKNVYLPPATTEDNNSQNSPKQVKQETNNHNQNNTSVDDNSTGILSFGSESFSDYLDDLKTLYYDLASADTQDFVASIPEKVQSAEVQTMGNIAVAIPLLASVFLSTKSFAGGVPVAGFASYLLYFIPQLLKIKRKSKPWGTVYDSVTKRPIPFARVDILNTESRKLESAVTDAEGRYGFLVSPQFSVGNKALIQLRVYQKNYSFPSVEIPTANEEVVYEKIYQGGLVDVSDMTVNFDIPMDPVSTSKLMFGTTYFAITSVTLNNLWTKLANLLFILGMIFSIANYTSHPSVWGMIPIGIVLFTSLLRVSGFKLKPFGLTKESVTNSTLPFTFIALHDISGVREKFTVSDEKGRYFILSTKGQHYIKAYTPAHITPMRQVTLQINTKEGWVSKEIQL